MGINNVVKLYFISLFGLPSHPFFFFWQLIWRLISSSFSAQLTTPNPTHLPTSPPSPPCLSSSREQIFRQSTELVCRAYGEVHSAVTNPANGYKEPESLLLRMPQQVQALLSWGANQSRMPGAPNHMHQQQCTGLGAPHGRKGKGGPCTRQTQVLGLEALETILKKTRKERERDYKENACGREPHCVTDLVHKELILYICISWDKGP